MGVNCRFLQDPKGLCGKGSQRGSDNDVIYQMKRCVESFSEGQISFVNYKKGGKAFRNLVTLIPICMDNSNSFTHYVGLQVDVVARTNVIFGKLNDTRLVVNYQNPYLTPTSSNGSQEETAPKKLIISHQFVDVSSTLVHIVTLRGAFMYLSAVACQKLLGFNNEDLVGKNMSEIMHIDDYAYVMRQFKELKDGAVISYLCRLKDKAGKYIYLDVKGHVIKFDLGFWTKENSLFCFVG